MKQGKGMTKTDQIRDMLRRKTSVETIAERLKVNKNRVWWVRWDMGRKKNGKPAVKKAVAPKKKTDSMGVVLAGLKVKLATIQSAIDALKALES